MMPEVDGWEICGRLREIADIPIIMLTAKTEKNDIIRGFQLGSEDYVTKPFSLQELELRINAVLRRTEVHRSELTACYDDG
jgi:DNA-binding response OmpR family regulator